MWNAPGGLGVCVWLRDAFQDEPRIDHRIEPIRERAVEPGNFERRQRRPPFGRRRRERPALDFAIPPVEIAAWKTAGTRQDAAPARFPGARPPAASGPCSACPSPTRERMPRGCSRSASHANSTNGRVLCPSPQPMSRPARPTVSGSSDRNAGVFRTSR